MGEDQERKNKMFLSLENFIETLRKGKKNKKSFEKSSLNSSLSVEPNFHKLQLKPSKSLSDDLYKLLQNEFERTPRGYTLDWDDFNNKFLDESYSLKLPKLILDYFEADIENGNDVFEGASKISEIHDTAYELIRSLPHIDQKYHFKLKVNMSGFTEIDLQILTLIGDKSYNITDRFIKAGPLVNIGANNTNRTKYILVPFWIYQIYTPATKLNGYMVTNLSSLFCKRYKTG